MPDLGISAGTAMLAGSALQAGTSAVSGALGAGASTKAARDQMIAAGLARQAVQQNIAQEQGIAEPYTSAGSGAINTLLGELPGMATSLQQRQLPSFSAMFGSPAQMQSWLEGTPGYQFNLAQGMKGIRSQYGALGLGGSPSADAALASFVQGTAQNTFQSQFQNWLATGQTQYSQQLQQNQQQIGALLGTGQIGGGVTGSLLSAMTQGTGQIANLITGAGAAAGAGVVGATNAITGALGNIGGIGSNLATLYALSGGGQGSIFGGGAANPGSAGSTIADIGNMPA